MTNFWTSLAVQWLGLHDSTALQERKIRSLAGELRSKKKKERGPISAQRTWIPCWNIWWTLVCHSDVLPSGLSRHFSSCWKSWWLKAYSWARCTQARDRSSLRPKSRITPFWEIKGKLVGSIQDNSEGQPAPELPVRLAEVSVVTASCPTFPQ